MYSIKKCFHAKSIICCLIIEEIYTKKKNTEKAQKLNESMPTILNMNESWKGNANWKKNMLCQFNRIRKALEQL